MWLNHTNFRCLELKITELEIALRGLTNNCNRAEILRPCFSWPGNKYDQLKYILPHLPHTDRYMEVCGGSGAVMLNRHPSKLEIFNDRYAGITCFFRVMRDPMKAKLFMERIAITLHSREEFIWSKATWKNCEDEVERAARWYYTAQFAVNGKPHSSFGRSKSPKVTFADRLVKRIPLLYPIHYRMKTVQIENLDWRTCLEDYDQPGMVNYIDPDYLDSDPAYEHNWKESDHKELIDRVSRLQGFVAVSSYDSPRANAIYDRADLWTDKVMWDRTTTATTQTKIGNNHEDNEQTTDRYKVREVLWIRDKL